VAAGAHLEAANKRGQTALWLAAHHGHLDCVQTLCAASADPDAVDARKLSCLGAAFRKGHLKVVKYLLKHVRHFPSDQDCKRYV
jgi:ankyrin repeat domain-containing protein 17